MADAEIELIEVIIDGVGADRRPPATEGSGSGFQLPIPTPAYARRFLRYAIFIVAAAALLMVAARYSRIKDNYRTDIIRDGEVKVVRYEFKAVLNTVDSFASLSIVFLTVPAVVLAFYAFPDFLAVPASVKGKLKKFQDMIVRVRERWKDWKEAWRIDCFLLQMLWDRVGSVRGRWRYWTEAGRSERLRWYGRKISNGLVKSALFIGAGATIFFISRIGYKAELIGLLPAGERNITVSTATVIIYVGSVSDVKSLLFSNFLSITVVLLVSIILVALARLFRRAATILSYVHDLAMELAIHLTLEYSIENHANGIILMVIMFVITMSKEMTEPEVIEGGN